MSIKMCFWEEVSVFFVLHNYYDMNIIFFVFVGLERKVFAIPQLSPILLPGRIVFGVFSSFWYTDIQHRIVMEYCFIIK